MLLSEVDGVAEARLLHPGNFGYFAVMNKTACGGVSQRMYSRDHLETVVSAMRSAPDAYISQSSFLIPRRRVSALGEMRAAFVDIDCYAVGETPSDSFIQDVLGRAQQIGLPLPSYIVGSGRGLYAKWIFNTPITAAKLIQWNALQSALNHLYRAIGADVRARDAARVLRVLGTTNRKADTSEVRVRFDSGLLHSFDDLCALVARADFSRWLADEKAAGGVDTPKVAGRPSRDDSSPRKVKSLREQLLEPADTDLGVLDAYAGTRQPILLKSFTKQSLNWQRFTDLRTLALRRQGIARGSRDLFMFWMMTFLAHAEVVNAQNFWGEAKAIAQFTQARDFSPLRDGSLSTLYQRVCDKISGRKVKVGNATYDPVYTASNAHLIEALEITGDEQQHLSTIICPAEKRRRADSKVPGRAERREARLVLRDEAAGLVRDGATAVELVARTGCSRSKAYHLVRQLGAASSSPPVSSSRSGKAWQADARQLVADGLPAAEISRRLGVHRSTVTRFLQRTELMPAGGQLLQIPPESSPTCRPTPPGTSSEVPTTPALTAMRSAAHRLLSVECEEIESATAVGADPAMQALIERSLAAAERAQREREREKELRDAEIAQQTLAMVSKVEELRRRALSKSLRASPPPVTNAVASVDATCHPGSLEVTHECTHPIGPAAGQGQGRSARPAAPGSAGERGGFEQPDWASRAAGSGRAFAELAARLREQRRRRDERR